MHNKQGGWNKELKFGFVLLAGLLVAVSWARSGHGAVSKGFVKLDRDYAVKPVPFTAVHLNDKFWAPKIEVNRSITIPYAFQQCVDSGRMRNFENAAETLRGVDPNGRPLPGYPFDDTDPYKVLEGASYSLSVQPDPKLDAYLDNLIKLIGSAQEADGYLYTARTINPAHPHDWSGHERWVNEEDESHELYDAGHLYQAAVAHYLATGKRSLLDIAIKNANLLVKTFGPGKRAIWPGHEVVEMGLCGLYRVTGDRNYLDLAKFFLDSRHGGDEYHQAQEPVVNQTKAVGHAVRAGYLYSGMADVAALTGDSAYVHAIDTIWQDVVGGKLYITGGIGAVPGIEGFGPDDYLPNMSAYCETCAAVANAYWNERLFLLHGDARYIDVLERTMYNGLISGVGLDGKSFFYPNPLESRGGNERSPWFGVACCPGNITRFLPSVPGYFYAEQGSNLYVNLFAAGTAKIKLDSGQVLDISQQTQYPWDGRVKMTLNPDRAFLFTVDVRIPGWARNEPVPSDLYKFEKPATQPVVLAVNGRPVSIEMTKGYAVLTRRWKRGDVISLDLPMPIRRIVANGGVKADVGRVALQRGPVVFCAEWKDNPGGQVRNLMVPDDSRLTAQFEPAVLNGVETIRGSAVSLSQNQSGQVQSQHEQFTAIPYYAWANRGRGEMMVWLPNSAASAHIQPAPTISSTAKVRTSGGTNRVAINDQHEPKSSYDQDDFFHWWPKKGTTEWVEYTFAKPETLSSSKVYWFDDTNYGECRVPQSWRLLYKDGDDWKPVELVGGYGTAKDGYNNVTFKSITTTQMRLEVQLQPTWSAGIQQWIVQ